MVTKLGVCFHTWDTEIWTDVAEQQIVMHCIRCGVRYAMDFQQAAKLITNLLNVATDFAPGTLSTYLASHEAC